MSYVPELLEALESVIDSWQYGESIVEAQDYRKAQLINWEKELAPYFKSENDIEVEQAIIPKSLFDKLKKWLLNYSLFLIKKELLCHLLILMIT